MEDLRRMVHADTRKIFLEPSDESNREAGGREFSLLQEVDDACQEKRPLVEDVGTLSGETFEARRPVYLINHQSRH